MYATSSLYTHMHACTHERTHTRTHARTHACAHTNTHMHAHTHACMHAHTHKHMHTHTHAHTHTHNLLLCHVEVGFAERLEFESLVVLIKLVISIALCLSLVNFD